MQGLARFTAEELEELDARGREYGLSASEVAAADKGGMPLGSYSRMRSVQTIKDFERAREAERLEAEGRRAAELERAKEAARRNTG